MTLYPCIIKCGYLDAAGRTSEIAYHLDPAATALDSGNIGPSMTDVLDTVDALTDALKALTMSKLDYAKLEITLPGGDGAVGAAANNQVSAFTRTTATGSTKSGFEVPGWDDVTFVQDDHNLISAAYNTLAQAVVDVGLIDPQTGQSMVAVSWSQSRTRKSRNVLS